MSEQYIIIGKFGAAHGVKGWVRVICFTKNQQSMVDYRQWFQKTKSGWREINLANKQTQAKHLVVQIVGCENRDDAQLLTNTEIAVKREQLPEPGDNQYYWADLEGSAVALESGAELGTLDHLMETGANDIMVVLDNDKKRHLVPFLTGTVVKSVDIKTKKIVIDWDPDY